MFFFFFFSLFLLSLFFECLGRGDLINYYGDFLFRDANDRLEENKRTVSQFEMPKDYDYLLKVLLVGDSDVGKHEIMAGLEDASSESPFCSRSGNCKLEAMFILLIMLVKTLMSHYFLKIRVILSFFSIFQFSDLINLSIFYSNSIQNHYNSLGWQTSSTSAMGYIRPRPILHDNSFIFTWCTGRHTGL